MSFLWPIDEYATCLCASCNNFKKDRFPIDVYPKEKLDELSRITGMKLSILKKKAVNLQELRRILVDVEKFANAVDARTFNAIARKVEELLPSVRLLELLKGASPNTYARVRRDLAIRPEEDILD